MTAQDRRAAATARRIAAEQVGERGGDAAYQQYRLAVPGVGDARRVPSQTVFIANMEKRDGKDLVHTSGYFTRYGVAYPMWDQFGEYEESIAVGAGASTLASSPDVAFLVNHGGVTMARTTNGTLVLEERSEGGHHDAWLNPKRQDVSDLVVAMQDGHVDQMSFAFMIPDGQGLWSEDFAHFEIRRYDIHRGDVSAVNYGASPYTDIAARTAEVLNDLDHLPMGALRAAEERLVRRGLRSSFARGGVVERSRERIEVDRREPTVIAKGSSSRAVRRLEQQVAHTGVRYVDLAARRGLDVAELLTAKLPWFEIRNAAGDELAEGEEPDTATVYVFDEIGGSFGVDAKTFAAELDEITAPKISVRINSPGGSVFDGIAIHSALLHHPAQVTTYVDGMALSAASVIAMAGDRVVMMPGAQMMIHDASMTDNGTAADKEAARAYLDRQSDNIADMYAGRAGGDRAEWRALMLEETWALGAEAVDLGLADEVFERPLPIADPEIEQRMRRVHDVSGRYRYSNRAAAPDPLSARGQVRVRLTDGGVHIPASAVERFGSALVEKLNESRTEPTPAPLSRRGSAPNLAPRTLTVTDVTTGEKRVVGADGDRQDRPKGRSIALVEAQLALDEKA